MPRPDPAELAWGDLELVLAVCRAGSLSGAARALGVTHSTIYRRLNTIESSAGVRFFERLPTGYTMTEAGELALEAGERVEAEFVRLSTLVLGRDAELEGTVRLTAPEGMVHKLLPPWLAEFRKLHPRVLVEVGGGSAAADLVRREADLAIRATRTPPDEALGRRIGRFRFTAFASPEYAKAHAGRPLSELDLVVLDGALPLVVPLVLPTVAAVMHAARCGMGVAFMSCYRGDLEPGLVRFGPVIESLDMSLWVLTHPALKHTARVKALMRFLVDKLLGEADLFDGQRPQPIP